MHLVCMMEAQFERSAVARTVASCNDALHALFAIQLLRHYKAHLQNVE